MREIDLSTFDDRDWNDGRRLRKALWFCVGQPVLRSAIIPGNSLRIKLLRLFGASIAANVAVRPGVRVKYPWLLSVGEYTWIGEDCWIDNLARVDIGAHACLSQGTYLCTGNHDWSDRAFHMVCRAIRVEDGAWIGAQSVVCPGVTVHKLSVLMVGSVARRDVPEREVHGGNPAAFVRNRNFQVDATLEAPQPRQASAR